MITLSRRRASLNDLMMSMKVGNTLKVSDAEFTRRDIWRTARELEKMTGKLFKVSRRRMIIGHTMIQRIA